MTMKRFLCTVLSAAIVFAASAFYSSAASDKCLRLTDTTGDKGYSAATDELNQRVASEGGATLIVDVLADSLATPTDDAHSRIAVFTGGPSYNLISYDFTEGAFTSVVSTNWILNQTSFEPTASQSFEWKLGQWYELAFQFDGNTATAYVDGIPMISAKFDNPALSYVIMYPQFCNLRIDNLRLCSKDYNVRDRYGDVWATDDFSDATLMSTANWVFSGGGYSVGDGGRAMPELGEMIPKRTVTPSIDGSYLRHSGGTGLSGGMDFSKYNGYTVVWDVRFDSLASSAHTAVRVGTSYIAGYDVKSGAFMVSTVAGFGFSSTAYNIFAKTPYTLSAGTTYEMAVRQHGDCVSVYLNGCLMAKAQNSKLLCDLSSVYLSNYNADVAIDNMIVAYSDFNVRERTGSRAAEFTFDEAESVIAQVCDFHLGNQAHGYSVIPGDGMPALSVSSATANLGETAEVTVSIDNTDGITGFIADVQVSDMLEIVGVTSPIGTLSPNGSNPVRLVWQGDSVAGGVIMTLNLRVPANVSDGDVCGISASLVPYKGDTVIASATANGSVTAKVPVLPALPTGVAFNGKVLSWNAVDSASAYAVYLASSDGEYLLGRPGSTSFAVDTAAYITAPGDYDFTVYASGANGAYIGKSDSLRVVRDGDSVIHNTVDAFKNSLASKIDAFIATREYTAEDASAAARIASSGKASISAAECYDIAMDAYNSCIAELSTVPTKDERENMPRITAQSVTAHDGVAEMVVSVAKNPGIVMLDLSVSYDTDKLSLTSITYPFNEDAFYCEQSELSASPVTVSIQAQEYAIEGDCALFTLTFNVKDGAPDGDYLVDISVDSVYDADFNEAELVGGSGTVTVSTAPDVLLGDANGDGIITAADALLISRKLSGWDVQLEIEASDVNGDGMVTASDALLISRKLSGWTLEFVK